ncbi:DUF6468 domain-containing protein [Pseudemcibacter aquimaris]|uniref:DUF6468 domain-containing protein n=1 Tax=Pseudemcibacter aquimaris TaxID=2857064 RepID=UPI00201345FD|nr:DUF6468 domain-containing protein [Pseudemcibacter aquimaris]MCC3860816.1 DUF6468 domain-containing protein [Pseudemcibacter aquimaris]WDU59636.1 hypothetical protein KW060_05095 [Pseudemcibacter aquimaris]
MTFTAENLINIVILIMLAVMIGYCVVLNKRLKAFRTIKQEMADMINQLNTSTANAQRSIAEFKNLVLTEEKKLADKLKEAADMADELDLINKTGSNLADRIEKGLTSGKTEALKESFSFFDEDENVTEEAAGQDENATDETSELRESLRNVR